MQTEKLKSTGFDIPQAAELIHELAAAGLPVKKDAITVDECRGDYEAVMIVCENVCHTLSGGFPV